MLWSVFLVAVKFCIAGVVILYAGMVAIALQTQGTRYRVQHNWHDPAGTAERFLVWVGVWAAGRALCLLKASLGLLEQASADVGEWILNHR